MHCRRRIIFPVPESDLPQAAVDLIRYLDQIAEPERNHIIDAIRGQWNKPRVSLDRQKWRVRLGSIEETGMFESWTEAVAYARQWHANIYRADRQQHYWPGSNERWQAHFRELGKAE